MDSVLITRDALGKFELKYKTISPEAAAGMPGVAATNIAADTSDSTNEPLIETKMRLARLILMNMSLTPEMLL